MGTKTAALPSERKGELRSAGLKIAGALVVAAVLYAFYSHALKVEAEVDELLAGPKIAGGERGGGAKAALDRDTPRALVAAEKSIREALALKSSNAYAIAAYADVEMQLVAAGYADRAHAAKEAIARAESKDVKLPERYEARGLQMLEEGTAPEAEAYATALLAQYGGVPRLLDVLGRAQAAQGKLTEARMSFRKAQEAEWRSPRFAADHGFALLEEGNAAEAAAAFERALQANPDHLRAKLGKARALLALLRDGKTIDAKQAVALADEVAQLPAHELPGGLAVDALAVRAEARLATGDAAGAAKDVAQARQLDPRRAWGLRANAMLAATEKGNAAALFLGAADAAPYEASLYFDGGRALVAAGDFSGAEKLLRAYSAHLPQTARYHLALATVLTARDELKAAGEELRMAQQLEPTNALVYFEQGRLAQREKNVKAAVAAYERAAQLRDDLPDVYRQMGSLYLENRQLEQAIRVFNEALLRYKAARSSPAVMEAFCADVQRQVTDAGRKELAEEWVKEARASH